MLAMGAGPVLAESPDPGGGSTADAAGTDTTDADSDGDTPSGADGTGTDTPDAGSAGSTSSDADGTGTDTTDVDSDGDTPSDADATGVNGSGVIELVADDFVGIDSEIYFVDDPALLDGLAAGDRVTFTYELDDNGEPVILTIDVTSDDLGDASGTNDDLDADTGDAGTGDGDAGDGNGVDADAGSDPDDGASSEDGDDGSENGATSASASSAQRRGLRAYNVLRYQVLPKAPEAARPALLRTIQRLADRLGLIVDFSGDAPVGNAGALDPAALGVGAGKTKHAEKFANKHGDADAPPGDSEVDGDADVPPGDSEVNGDADAPPGDSEVSGDDSSKGSDGPPGGRGRGRTR
jgi:hypothetical protein